MQMYGYVSLWDHSYAISRSTSQFMYQHRCVYVYTRLAACVCACVCLYVIVGVLVGWVYTHANDVLLKMLSPYTQSRTHTRTHTHTHTHKPKQTHTYTHIVQDPEAWKPESKCL